MDGKNTRDTRARRPVDIAIVAGPLGLAFTAASPVEGAFNTHKVNGDLAAGGSVEWFRISTDGNWVVYLADQDTSNAKEIYSVPVGGGVPVRLNPPSDRRLDPAFRDHS